MIKTDVSVHLAPLSALNIQSDSLRAKVFKQLAWYSCYANCFNLACFNTAFLSLLCTLDNGARYTECLFLSLTFLVS